MLKYTFLLTISLITCTAFSQAVSPNVFYESEIVRRQYEVGVTRDELWAIRKQEIIDSYDAIKTLKNGTLVFLLNFKKNEYDYYLKYGNTKAAKKLKEEQAKVNKNIILAMDSLFTFCPVIYVSTNDARHLLNKNYDSLTFYNSNLETNNTAQLREGTFLIGEFGHIEADEAVYSVSDSINKNYGENKTYLNALVIRKPNMRQLRKPFPYYQKYFPLGLVNKRYKRPARLLNLEMNRYFNKGEPTFVRKGK